MDKTFSSYSIRKANPSDVSQLHEISRTVACNLGGIIHSDTFRSIIKSKKIILVAEAPNFQLVGFIIAKVITKGVCYNLEFGVKPEYRRMGIGGGLLITLLKIIHLYGFHKWFAMFPSYNHEVAELYQTFKFPIEGVLREHTRAKTDMTIVAFYLDKMEIPKFWCETNHDAVIIRDEYAMKDTYDLPSNMVDGTFTGDGVKKGITASSLEDY